MISPVINSSKIILEDSSLTKAPLGEFAGRTITVKNSSQVSPPSSSEATDLRDVLLEKVKLTLEILKTAHKSLSIADNKVFVAAVSERIPFWEKVQQKVADTSNICSAEQLQGFYNLVQRDNLLLKTPMDTVPQFILCGLSKFRLLDILERIILLEHLAKENEQLYGPLKLHLEAMLEQSKKGDIKEFFLFFMELNNLLPGGHLEEDSRVQLQNLAFDKLEESGLSGVNIDFFSLSCALEFVVHAEILLEYLKPDSEESKALLSVLSQMEIYLREENPIGVSMLWEKFLISQAEALFGQEQGEEGARVIRFVYKKAKPLKDIMEFIMPGYILEEARGFILTELLKITDDIAAHHPEFTKNLGQWLGSYSADNRLYANLLEQGKQGLIQHPTKFAVWVNDLTALIKKGLPNVPEQYSKILDEASHLANFIAVKQN